MFHPQGPSFLELARQALCSTERGYDLLAPKFDYTPFRTPAALLDPVTPWIQDEQVDTALDVCCGTGAAMRWLRPLCHSQVVGIDFSHRMMEVGRKRTADADGEARLAFVRGNVLQMPFDRAFDLAVCFGALGHILPKDQDRFVAEVARALKPRGRFVLVTAPMPSRTTRQYWMSRGFNAAMHLRNWLVRPPFIMFYLTFLLPTATELLQANGFRVQVQANVFPPPFESAYLVIGTLNG